MNAAGASIIVEDIVLILFCSPFVIIMGFVFFAGIIPSMQTKEMLIQIK